ncbi:MAG: hypothetical protein KPEEDBHJ_00441 [Anaerolineales bacterium]|nr:hypothetical protein [Anaerolineales bacterium]
MSTSTPFSPISQDEINNILWKACDMFRGTVVHPSKGTTTLVMVLLKYINGENT